MKLPAGTSGGGTQETAQAIDVLRDLTGAEAEWRDVHGNPGWSGWLPHLDLQVARAFTAASADHQRLFHLLNNPGTLVLRAQLDLWYMLHPLVQPNAKLDYEYPPETVTVIFRSDGELQLKSTAAVSRAWRPRGAPHGGQSRENQWLPVEIALPTGSSETKLERQFLHQRRPARTAASVAPLFAAVGDAV